MKLFYTDFYGNTASITKSGDKFRLVCRNCYGKKWKDSTHISENAAKSALRRTGEGWRKK